MVVFIVCSAERFGIDLIITVAMEDAAEAQITTVVDVDLIFK